MEGNLGGSFNYCLGCLSLTSAETQKLYNYTFLCSSLKDIFKMQSLNLCYVCRRIAQHAETFIQNVQTNQLLLENFNNVTKKTIKSLSLQIQPPVTLNKVSFDQIELSGTYNTFTETEESFYITWNNSTNMDEKVKIEIKEEADMFFSTEPVIDDNDIPDMYLNEENVIPLTEKLDKESETEKDNTRSKIVQKECKANNKSRKKSKNDIPKIQIIKLTRKQIMDERIKKAKDPRYLNAEYKCTDCIKIFSCKGSYDIHMENHYQCVGDHQCVLCKQRTDTKEKLYRHMRLHHTRYKCMECGFTRSCRKPVMIHYSQRHVDIDCPYSQYSCTQCKRTFSKSAVLERHMLRVHRERKRPQCGYCGRTYCDVGGLRRHMMLKHTKEMAIKSAPIKKCICPECGESFETLSKLKYHSYKHLNKKDFYCVECDKSFKSQHSLQIHLKSYSLHVDYKELPFGCSYCDKRFSIRRDVTRHTNGVHLKIKPFACDKCEKTYGSSWSLKEHQRYSHDGYKKPLRFPCPRCDKVFSSNAILKSHILTHTGERPFQCPKCPATFRQASILRTHDRLVHLKVPRTVRNKKIADK